MGMEIEWNILQFDKKKGKGIFLMYANIYK